MKCHFCGKENLDITFEDEIEWENCPDCGASTTELNDSDSKEILENLRKQIFRGEL